ncbi:MAG: hypothetical protein WBC82_10535 [Dehalococcoidia bacterium]
MECFLCSPDRALVYLSSRNFYALLGLGPIVEGYTVVATRSHLPSMMDLPTQLLNEYTSFMERVRATLGIWYGPCTVTEHGRVPASDFRSDREGEGHCYHAHQLIFPVDVDLWPVLCDRFGEDLVRFGAFRDAWAVLEGGLEYLYLEDTMGGCVVATPRGGFPRRFFRGQVAEALGVRYRADWREYGGRDLIAAAQKKLLRKDHGMV